MPELPEVEVTRLGLAERLRGACILSSHTGLPLRWPLGCKPATLVGQTVGQVRRRGKYLLFDLDRGLLLIHLGMSGSLTFAATLPPRGKHDHFELLTDQGILRLHDPRRFGAVVYSPSEQHPSAQKLLGRLGVEPLSSDFTVDTFWRGLQGKSASIKQVLLAGHVVVGVGNIYACEALFQAGIRPTVSAGRISRARASLLHTEICAVLRQAIKRGGSTLRNFSNAQGQAGHFQLETQVYDRVGLPCKVCTRPIQKITQGQRSTFFCTRCQR